MHLTIKKGLSLTDKVIILSVALLPLLILIFLIFLSPKNIDILLGTKIYQTKAIITELPYREVTMDPYFPSGVEYLGVSGKKGSLSVETFHYQAWNNQIHEYTIKTNYVASVPDQYFLGNLPLDEAQEKFKTKYQTCIQYIRNQEWELLKTCDPHITESVIQQFKNQNALTQRKLNSFTDISILINSSSTFTENLVEVGSILVTQRECSTNAEFKIAYDITTKEFTLIQIFESINNACNPQPSFTMPQQLTCTDCWLAPVGKKYMLSPEYRPSVVHTGLNGGGFVTTKTRDALQKMFQKAQNLELSPLITSSYRSYGTQVTLFSSYVNTEMKNGLSRSEAETKANTYSSKAGFSEHQLGTTLDIKGPGVYDFLENNAHLYGFVISYPRNCQNLTGYIYEPWHVRFIGKEYATELYNLGYLYCKNGMHLGRFLEIKSNY